MKINDQEGKTLMALRAGPTGSHELYERFPSGPATSSLVKKGLIELRNGEYYITELGREHCPVRRQPKQAAEKTLPVLLQEQTVQKVVSKPETISITPVFNIVKAVPTVKAVPEKEPEMSQPETQTTFKSKALQMLEYIEQHPKSTMTEMVKNLGMPLGESLIPGYIDRGLVIIEKNEAGKKTYRLANGWTAQSAVNSATRQLKNQAEPNVKVTAEPGARRADYVESQMNAKAKAEAPEEYDIPSFLRQPSPELKLEIAEESAVDGKHIPAPAQSGSFRCAYTNDGCIMLLGIHVLPIELNAAQTNDLIEFISETITPIGVAI